MQYHEYISQYQARREREQQLIQKYNQRPLGKRVNNFYFHTSVERHENLRITAKDILSIVAAFVIIVLIVLAWSKS